ncbi:MAG: TonB family protein [Bacillota bacterium]
MPENDNQNKLAAYVVFSIILHLLLLYFIPFGFMQGNVRGENSDLNDYGYVQIVEYQPAPMQVEDPVPQEEVEEITAEQEEIPEEIEEPEPEEMEKPEEIEEPEEVQEPEPEPEPEPEIDETQPEEETDLQEEDIPQENETVEEIVEEEAENINENDIDEVTNEIENTEAVEETEVLSSEESDIEVEIQEEDNATAEDNVQSAENTEQPEEEVEQNPPPPPPPTSGELISVMVKPAFPKDLVGNRAEGIVKLTAKITPAGAVDDISINESSGYDTMDRIAVLTIERGWSFKAYNKSYLIPIEVKYYIDESDNSQVDVSLGNVEFLTGGE